MRRLLLLILLLSGACAVGDTAQPTAAVTEAVPTIAPAESPAPRLPLTLAAPPPVQYTGLCADTFPLENWLQISTRLVSDFQAALNGAVGLPADQVYDVTLNLVNLRDAVAAIPTPDCAAASQVVILDAFNQALPPFQAVANGENTDLTPTITAANGLLEVVKIQQAQLLDQLNAQFAAP